MKKGRPADSGIIIAAAGGGPENARRDELWQFCRPRWEKLAPVYVGDPGDPDVEVETYNRADAINDAVEAATEAHPKWDTVVIIDRDVAISRGQVGNAITLSRSSARAVLPFREYHPLTERATNVVLGGNPPPKGAVSIQNPPGVMTNHVSSCIVVPRALWEKIGGFDNRFVGWGCEDRAFHAACGVLGGVLGGLVERTPGIVYHLWHPSVADTASEGFRANKTLERMYTTAKTPEQMLAVIRGLV